MSLINVSDLSFSYEGSSEPVFENVSFQIDTDWRLGFTGRNGRGKTTFLKLLQGLYEYKGTISSSVKFEYFPYEVGDESALAVEIAERICPEAQSWELLRELSILEFKEEALYQPFETLSNGERTKLLLAAMFLKENSFLLIDEPTNHLDMRGRELVSAYLNRKKGFILVSHDRAFLDGCIDHILAINRSDIEIQKGNFSSWMINKERRDGFELSQNEKLKNDIKRLSAAAKQTSRWSDSVEKTKYGSRNSGLRPDRGFIGHKAAKMMKRSKAIEARQLAAAEEKSKLLKNIESSEALKLSGLSYHSERLISFKDVSISYGGKAVCENVSFDVVNGGRIAIHGKNGSGKSSILKLITGMDIPHSGTVRIGSGLVMSYVPQDASFLTGSLKDYAEQMNIDESLFKAILRKLDFSRAQFEKDMKDFSGGQKKKVLIAMSLCQKAHLYIWDEPLNFIDVISRMQIEELILEYQPTMIFVEHDKAFCKSIATEAICL